MWNRCKINRSLLRKYDGTPSLETALENKKILQEALVAAGKKFKEDISVGAVYERYFSLTHHNEIWLYSAWKWHPAHFLPFYAHFRLLPIKL